MFFLCCFIYGDCGPSWCPLGGTVYSRETPEQLCGSENVAKTYIQKVVCSKIGEILIWGELSQLKTTEEDAGSECKAVQKEVQFPRHKVKPFVIVV